MFKNIPAYMMLGVTNLQALFKDGNGGMQSCCCVEFFTLEAIFSRESEATLHPYLRRGLGSVWSGELYLLMEAPFQIFGARIFLLFFSLF